MPVDAVSRALVRSSGKEVLDAVAFRAANRRAVEQYRAARPTVSLGAEAVCYFHEHLQATAACDGCGGFLCALCALPVGGRTLCPNCVMKDHSGTPTKDSLSARALWGSRALTTMILSLVIPVGWFVLPLIAIGVMTVVWKFWDAPGSLVRPQRSRMVLAVVLALIGFVGGLGWWYVIFRGSILSQP